MSKHTRNTLVSMGFIEGEQMNHLRIQSTTGFFFYKNCFSCNNLSPGATGHPPRPERPKKQRKIYRASRLTHWCNHWKKTICPFSPITGKQKIASEVNWLLIIWTLVLYIVLRKTITFPSLTSQSLLMTSLSMCSQFLIAKRWILFTPLLKLSRSLISSWMPIIAVFSVSTTWTWILRIFLEPPHWPIDTTTETTWLSPFASPLTLSILPSTLDLSTLKMRHKIMLMIATVR